MEYSIYKTDGSILTSPNFLLTGVSPVEMIRTQEFYPVIDVDKPQEYYFEPVIGYTLNSIQNSQNLYRYQGNYVPKFRDVLKFYMREDDNLTSSSYQDFLLNNTHIGTHLADFSLLKNQYYYKVAENEILKLSSDAGYFPVYPIINEIAIDKKPEFIWSSTWDKDYYRLHTSTSEYTNINGTSSMIENKSWLGSKLMKTPLQYNLYQFKITMNGSSNFSSFTDKELVYFEDTDYLYIQVNVYAKLLREMLGTSINLNAQTSFIDVINRIPTAFDSTKTNDYVTSYLENNILDLYEITQTTLYLYQSGTPNGKPTVEYTLDGSEHVTLTQSVLLDKKYISNNNVKTNTISDMIFQIKYPLDSRYYTSFSIGVTVNRI